MLKLIFLKYFIWRMNCLPAQFQIKTVNNTLMHQSGSSYRHHAAAGWLIILGCVTADAKYVYRLFSPKTKFSCMEADQEDSFPQRAQSWSFWKQQMLTCVKFSCRSIVNTSANATVLRTKWNMENNFYIGVINEAPQCSCILTLAVFFIFICIRACMLNTGPMCCTNVLQNSCPAERKESTM